MLYLHATHLTNCAVVHSKPPGDSKCFLIRRVLQDVVGGEASDQIALDRSREGHMRMDRFRIGHGLPTTDPTARSPHLHHITMHAYMASIIIIDGDEQVLYQSHYGKNAMRLIMVR